MIEEQVPRVGDRVQRTDDLRIGIVEHVARAGEPFVGIAPLHDGDVVVRISVARTITTSGGAYFWTKWRRVDVHAMATIAMDEALGGA